jgi:hypothetical protein
VPHPPDRPATAGIPQVSGGWLHLKPGQTVTTFGLFAQTYGRIEVPFRGNRGRFRLLPVPLATLPAIDVFELEPGRIAFGNRWGTEQTEHSFGDSFDLPTAPVHTVAVTWDASGITWSVDSKERFRSTEGVPRQPMFLTLEGSDGDLDIDAVQVFRVN